MRSTGKVARMGERRGGCNVLVERPDGKRQLGRPGVGGKIILKLAFKKWHGDTWTGMIRLRIGTSGWKL